MAKYSEIERRIRASIKSGKESIAEVLGRIDLELMISPRETYRKEAIVKAIILRDLSGLKFETSLEKYLNENKDAALKIGFLRGANGEVEIPDRRTFSHFLKHKITPEDLELISLVKETILIVTDKFDLPLNADIKQTPKKEGNLRITEEDKAANIRYLRKKLYPDVKLPVNRNAKHSKDQILDVLAYVASTGKYTNGGAESFEKIRQNSVKAYTILRHVERNKITEVVEMADKIIEKQFGEVNKNLRIKYATIAIDKTLIPFYDKGNERDGKSVYNFVVGGPEKSGTYNFIKYLTADIVHPKLKFTLTIVPRRSGVPLVEDVKVLINKVRKLVGIKLLLADRGFNGAEMFRMLDDEKVRYLMPLTESGGVKNLVKILPMNSVFKNLEYGSFGYKIPYFVYVEGSKGLMKIATSINIRKGDVAFIKELPKMYSKRWTIETGYRDKKRNAFARTTSTNYVVRLFYFVFSVLLYNVWSLVNFLLMCDLGLEALKRKIISLFSFIQRLYSLGTG